MTAFFGYNDLLIGVSDYTGRDDTAHMFDRFTALAEAKLNRLLRIADMEAETTFTTDADGEASLPADYIEAVSVTDSLGRVLRQASLNALKQLYGNRGGVPCSFAIVGTTIKVKPVAADTFDLVYYQRLPSLSATLSNWLLVRAPDVYLYSTAVEVGIWAKDAELVSDAQNLLDTALAQLTIDDERARWSLGTVKLTSVSP